VGAGLFIRGEPLSGRGRAQASNQTRRSVGGPDLLLSTTNAVASGARRNKSLCQIPIQRQKRKQDFQGWLEAGERRVIVPFAKKMAELIPPASVRLRRDVGQVIRAIKSHALMHREHRDRDVDGQIVANALDYIMVRELMNNILAEGSGLAVSLATENKRPML
jgi:hypothetical protein